MEARARGNETGCGQAQQEGQSLGHRLESTQTADETPEQPLPIEDDPEHKAFVGRRVELLGLGIGEFDLVSISCSCFPPLRIPFVEGFPEA